MQRITQEVLDLVHANVGRDVVEEGGVEGLLDLVVPPG
jgi:hypothetical protein